jgi:crossover junction endodeoxyribonuclease RuvC
MILIGIDPGYERLGIAVIEKPDKNASHNKKETLLYSDCFKTSSKQPFQERLFLLGKEVEALIQKYQPQTFAIETLFFQNNQKTAMMVAEVRGALLYIAKKQNLIIYEFTPLQVKVAVAGYGQADKKQVADMIHKLMIIEKEIAHDDEYDAIAIALTASAVIK